MVGRRLQAVLLGIVASACQLSDDAGGAAAAQTTPNPFQERVVAQFTSPWAMDFIPGSGLPLTHSALLSEKEGKLWIVNVDSGDKWPVAGLRKMKVAGQGGLGDVVAHPDFAANQRVYLSYVEGAADGTSGAVVAYATLNWNNGQPRLENFKLIWRQQPKVTGNGHFSHRIAFGPDGHLYLSSGDRQKFDPAQSLTGNLGKILRLTAEGAPVASNPWASRGGVAAQFWSIGHRNPLGLAFSADKRLWSTEMGPEGGDELNLILPGKNYGWPNASNGSHYGGADIPDHKAGDGYEAPRQWWNPSISPGGLLIYTGDRYPQWKGDALIPALSGKALIRIDVEGVKTTKANYWAMGRRIRAIDQGPDGRLFILEDGGKLVELTPK